MTDIVVRYQSRQGGPFRSDSARGLNNLVDFDIPEEEGAWDLDNSWINLYAEVDTVTDSNITDGVHNVRLQYLDALNGTNRNRSWYNAALIDNAHMTASRAGKLEDIRKVGILRQNLAEYTHYQSQKDGLRFKSGRQPADRTQLSAVILRQLNKEGNVNSQNLRGQFQIPLRDVFELGALREYHAVKWGRTRVHLELNTGILRAVEPAADDLIQHTSQLDMEDAGAVATDIDSITTTDRYDRLEDSPFWVGQVIQVEATGGTSPLNGTPQDAKITSIVWNKTGANARRLTLGLEWDGANPAGTATGVTVATARTTLITTSFVEAELVLKRNTNPGPAPDVLQYRTYTTEEFTGNGQTNFSRMFQLEPEAVNVLLMFPEYNLVSQNNNLTRYRLRLNNEDLIDRDVDPRNDRVDPLHYDRVNMTLLNCGLEMRCFQQRNYNQDQKTLPNQTDGTGNNLLLLGNPVPMTQREKNLQVNLTLTGAGLQRMNLYKQVMRTVRV